MLKDTSSVAWPRAANLPQLATPSVHIFGYAAKSSRACYDRLFLRILRTRALAPSPSACAARPAERGERAGRQSVPYNSCLLNHDLTGSEPTKSRPQHKFQLSCKLLYIPDPTASSQAVYACK